MSTVSELISQGVVALTKLPTPFVVAIMAVPLGFVGWSLQQFAQRRASRRTTMGRLRANLAYLHVALVRAAKSASLDDIATFPKGRLQETIDDDVSMHTVLARRELDLLRECIIEIEARLDAIRVPNEGDTTAIPCDLDQVPRLLDLVQMARAIIRDNRPVLDDRTLSSAKTWRAWALAVARGATLIGACAITSSSLELGGIFPGLVVGGVWVGLMIRNRAFRPVALRARLDGTRGWTTVAVLVVAVILVLFIGKLVWLESRIPSLASRAREIDISLVQTTLGLYGLVFVAILIWAMRYCLRRHARARFADDIAARTRNDGVCKLESELPDTRACVPCSCSGVTCLRKLAGIEWTTLQM